MGPDSTGSTRGPAGRDALPLRGRRRRQRHTAGGDGGGLAVREFTPVAILSRPSGLYGNRRVIVHRLVRPRNGETVHACDVP